MNLKIFLSACFFGMASAAVSAGPAEDAKFIVEQHIIHDEYADKLEVLEQNMFNNLQPGIERLGATIIDPERFMHELTGEFKTDYLSNILNSSAEAFVEYLSPQELTDLASFYRSDKGLELLSKTPESAADFETQSLFLNGPGMPILEHYTELKARMDQAALQSFSIIEASLTTSRIAEIFENLEIIDFENEETRIAVVEGLRSVDQ